MAYSFDDADAAERHETQYFEMFGNRGIYHKGWTAVTKHRTPWETGADAKTPAFDDDVWELYDTTTDWTQAHDLAARAPGEAARAAAPVADRGGQVQRACRSTTASSSAACPRRPAARRSIQGKRQLLFGGMGRLTENSVLMMKNTSFSLTAEVEVPEVGRRGRDRRPGRRVRRPQPLRQGRQAEVLLQLLRPRASTTSRAPRQIPPGEHQVRMEFAYDGGGVGKGGTVDALHRRQSPSASGRIEQTEAFLFSADETCDVGNEFGSPVTTDYAQREFTGEVDWVEIDLGLDDHNHMIKPEDRVNLAMGLQ